MILYGLPPSSHHRHETVSRRRSPSVLNARSGITLPAKPLACFCNDPLPKTMRPTINLFKASSEQPAGTETKAKLGGSFIGSSDLHVNFIDQTDIPKSFTVAFDPNRS